MKGLDTKKIVDAVTDKSAFMAIIVTLFYQIFVASRIPNKYLSNASIIVVPALLAGFIAPKDKSMVTKMVVAGLAVGGVNFIKDLLSTMVNSETDPAKKAKLTGYLTALNGNISQTVAGVGFPVASQQGVTYIPPKKNDIVNRAALTSNGGAY